VGYSYVEGVKAWLARHRHGRVEAQAPAAGD